MIAIILIAPLIVFENLALKNARNNPIECIVSCLDTDFGRTIYYILSGLWIMIANLIGRIFLDLIIHRERHIYFV